MSLTKVLLGAACAIFTFTAAAQPAAPSAADIARAKAAATQAATQARGLAAVRDATGEVVRGKNGAVQTTTQSKVTQQADLDYFKSLTGLEGLEQVATPGKGKAGIVNISTSQTFDLDCRRSPAGLIRAAAGVAFRFTSCTGSPPRSIQLAMCDATMRASQCAQLSDFNRNINVPVGSFVTVGGRQVGAGCNSQGVCRITVKGTDTIGGNDETIKQQARTRNAQSSIVGGLREKVEDGTYSAKMTEVGRPLMDCAEQNRRSLGANGTVSGCGDEGRQAVVVVNPSHTQQAAQCNTERKCLRWGTTTQTYTRSCTRTFPLTERITKYRFDTAECRIVETQHADGTTSRTNSCEQDGRSVTTEMNKVGQEDKQCTKREGDRCVEESWTEYYASKEPEVVSVHDSPSPVAGACDTSPTSETRYTGYEGGTWFGRTRPDNECISEIIDEGDGSGTGFFVQLTNAEKEGCGIYTTPSVGTTCYGQPSEFDDADTCATSDLAGCRLVSTTPGALTGGTTGLIMSQQETFQCERSQSICLEWSKGKDDAACMETSQMTFGNDETKTVANYGDGLNAALVAAAIVDATAEGVEARGGDEDPFVPLLFSGENMKCKRATGGIGQLFGRNCCRMDLERPIAGNFIRGGCDLDDVRLAAARRSHYTVYIGDYCSKKMRFPSRCLERTESYCTFNGVLPRLLHEQGRKQLASIAASSAGAEVERTNISFPYFDTGLGSWTSPINVNGVRIAAWKWPSYCVDPARAGEHMAGHPEAFECPGVVRTVIAACDQKGGCGQLPPAPEYGAGEWSLIEVNPLERATTAVSRYAVVTGACSTTSGNCSYQVSAWPIGQGGKAVITRDISWDLYSNEGPTTSAPGGVNQMTNLADLMFRTWSHPGMSDGKSMPSSVRIDFSHDGGQSWRTVQVPTDLTGREYVFPDGQTKMTGKCDALTNVCAFRVTGTLTITTKPWGSAKRPDCTGFTAGQLSAMDFGKMDLSEWLATVMDKVASSTPTELAKVASKQFQDFNALFQDGQGVVKATAPTGANFARVTPSQGFGPFDVQLVVSGFWPQTTGDKSLDTDVVTRVEVDWGDCTGKQVLPHISRGQIGVDELGNPIYAPTQPGDGYIGTHRFEAPDKLRCGAKRGNVRHIITVTAYTTKSGVQKRTLTVENAWSVFPGATGGNNDNVAIPITAPVNQNVPRHPTP